MFQNWQNIFTEVFFHKTTSSLLQAQWCHQGAEPLGRTWQKGNVVGCLLDMDERTMVVTLNGEVLFNDRGSELVAKDFDAKDGWKLFWFTLYVCVYIFLSEHIHTL